MTHSVTIGRKPDAAAIARESTRDARAMAFNMAGLAFIGSLSVVMCIVCAMADIPDASLYFGLAASLASFSGVVCYLVREQALTLASLYAGRS